MSSEDTARPRGRSIRRQYRGVRDDIGDLVTQRPLPNDDIEQVDPFLFLNHHGPQVYPPNNTGLPFGPHPHRGFETVTFIVEGSLVHRDTAGHVSAIRAGGVQWMTAGRGLEHAEVSPDDFLAKGGPLEILQLWVNLPARLKMVEPRYTGLQREDIPSFHPDEGEATVNLIAGTWDVWTGPVDSLTDVHMMTVQVPADGRISLPAPRGRNVFLYIVQGELTISGEHAMEFHLLDMNDDGDAISLQAVTDALLLFGHAAPIGETMVSQGPFVMNTRAEIVQAIQDYQAGKFAGKVRL